MGIFDLYSSVQDERKTEEYTLEEYLELCKEDPMAYATAAERMLKAIGDPIKIDTSTDPRLSRIFSNKIINVYEPFADFYGMEDTIERIVGFFKHAAQGLEEKKQCLYCLGPVGGGKSSLAEKIKELMEAYPVYVLKAGDEISPVFESPLGLFADNKLYVERVEEDYNIPSRYFINTILSPWAAKRLMEFDNDISKFHVVKMWPSRLHQQCIASVSPGDEQNQDISSLVGKTDIRKLEYFSQDDPDSYSFSGSLCKGNQGVMEFVEMFKAPIKTLHPMLTATQEGNYKPSEDGIGSVPFQGILLSHSNEAEWTAFKNNKNNEAFLDRIYIVKVPYCLRKSEEVKIYKKMISSSSLANAKCAPMTYDLLAEFSILSRLKEHENSTQVAKMRVYDGENMKDRDPKAKTMIEYRDSAGVDEGMNGMSTRFAFKVLSQTFNYDDEEVAADPVHLMMVLERAIKQEQFPEEREQELLEIIKGHMYSEYVDFIGNEIQKAYIESYSEYGQSVFDRYIEYADHWIQDIDYKCSDTGQLYNREVLNDELTKIEKPAGIANPKDFRAEVVNWVLRNRANNEGKNPKWTSYRKLCEVIEKSIFAKTEDILPVISFESKSNTDQEEKHRNFVQRMEEKGYTQKQVRRLVQWYMQVRKSS